MTDSKDNHVSAHSYTGCAGILPCPFCGGEPYQVQIGNMATKSRGFEIGCRNCRVKITDLVVHKDLEWCRPRNIENWNRRPGAPAQAASPRQQSIDGSIAAQLQRSMELNARMKNRLKTLLHACNHHQPTYETYDAASAIEAILKDEDPA